MALFLDKWGDIRGSVADITFSRNAGGAYIRSKVTPLNPQSVAQQTMRQILTTQAGTYVTLTDEQREGWKSLAQRELYTDIFGNKRRLTSLAMFVKANAMLQYCALDGLLDAPQTLTARGLNPITAAVTDAPNREVTVTYEPNNVATETLLLYLAVSVPSSINFVKNRYRLATFVSGVTTSPTAFTSPVELGPFVSGTKVWVRLVRLNHDTGGMSLAQETAALVP